MSNVISFPGVEPALMGAKVIPPLVLSQLDYDPTSPSGLRWIKRGSGRRKDLMAGYQRTEGYWEVNTYGEKYRAHRIVWEIHHGSIPSDRIVNHIDGQPGNNLIGNLELVTSRINTLHGKWHTESPVPLPGLSSPSHKWRVIITPPGQTHITIGHSDCWRTAYRAYYRAAVHYWGEQDPTHVPHPDQIVPDVAEVMNTLQQAHVTPYTRPVDYTRRKYAHLWTGPVPTDPRIPHEVAA